MQVQSTSTGRGQEFQAPAEAAKGGEAAAAKKEAAPAAEGAPAKDAGAAGKEETDGGAGAGPEAPMR